MGCDGGTIPRRDELVRLKKKPEQKDKESELSFRWRHCAISQQPLQPPIVACGLGRLYCKESVLEGLLDNSKMPETASHITSLKDVKELVLTTNPAYIREKGGEKGESGRYVDHRASPYACPVIGLELSGKFRFAFPWSCGCVVSEKALKEVPSKLCHKCQLPYDPEELVFLNAEDDCLELMKSRMESRKLHLKNNKKNKKQKPQASATVTSQQSDKGGLHFFIDDPKPSYSNIPPVKSPDESSSSNSEPTAESSSSASMMESTSVHEAKEVKAVEQPVEKMHKESTEQSKYDSHRAKRSHSPDSKHHRKEHKSSRESKDRKGSSHKSSHEHRDHKSSSRDRKSSHGHKSRDSKSSKIDSIADPAYKKTKLDYSVAKDPKATSVYKSLFTSHENAKSQTKAHWITYNPFYN